MTFGNIIRQSCLIVNFLPWPKIWCSVLLQQCSSPIKFIDTGFIKAPMQYKPQYYKFKGSKHYITRWSHDYMTYIKMTTYKQVPKLLMVVSRRPLYKHTFSQSNVVIHGLYRHCVGLKTLFSRKKEVFIASLVPLMQALHRS